MKERNSTRNDKGKEKGGRREGEGGRGVRIILICLTERVEMREIEEGSVGDREGREIVIGII